MSRAKFIQNMAMGIGFLGLRPLIYEAKGQDGLPKRVIFFHWGMGVPRHYWIDSSITNNLDLNSTGTILRHLSSYRDQIIVLDGIDQKLGIQNHLEDRCLLTGTPTINNIDRPGTGLPGSISLDQNLTSTLKPIAGGEPSVLLTDMDDGCIEDEEGNLICDATEYAEMFLSAEAPGKKNGKGMSEPPDVFRTLFRNVVPTADPAVIANATLAERSMLDATAKDLMNLMKKLSGDERKKLEFDLDSIRQLEKRISNPIVCTKPNEPGNVSQQNHAGVADRVSYFVKTIPLAVSCDLSRIFTIYSITKSHWYWDNNFDPLGLKSKGVLGNEPNTHDAYMHYNAAKGKASFDMHGLIVEWYVKKLVELLDGLKSVIEPGGTALDNTLVVFLSEEGCRYYRGDDGKAKRRDGSDITSEDHNFRDLPVLLAGGKNFMPAGGKYKDFASVDHRRLLVTIQNLLGNAEKRLPGWSQDFEPLPL